MGGRGGQVVLSVFGSMGTFDSVGVSEEPPGDVDRQSDDRLDFLEHRPQPLAG